MLFGVRMNRMKWSAFGSPLSRHEEGEAVHERKTSAVAEWWSKPLLDEMERLSPRDEQPEDLDPYVPEQAERPAYRPRMPRIEEFPMPVQNQMRARNGEAADDHEKRQMTLLEKLASSLSGKGRSEAVEERPVPMRRMPEVAQEPMQTRRPEGRDLLDPGSRPARAAEAQDDLEIPAFLRRQA